MAEEIQLTLSPDFTQKKEDLTSLLNKLIEGAKEGPLRKRLLGLKEYVNISYESVGLYAIACKERQAEKEKLQSELDELKEGLEVKVQDESGNETSLDRLRTERRRIRNRYESSQAQIKTLTEFLAGTKKELGDLRRITTRDVDGLKKVLKDHFNYKEKDFEAYKSRGELFQYLVSRIELEVATLRLKYEKETQE